MRAGPWGPSVSLPGRDELVYDVADTLRHPRGLLRLEPVTVEVHVPAERHDAVRDRHLDAIRSQRDAPHDRLVDLFANVPVAHRRRDDREVIVDRGNAGDGADAVGRGLLLVPVVDVAFQRDRAVAHDDLDLLVRHVRIPLERGAHGRRDLGVVRYGGAGKAHGQLVRDALRTGDLRADLGRLEAPVPLDLLHDVLAQLRVRLEYSRLHRFPLSSPR